jgi:hypothetical protein
VPLFFCGLPYTKEVWPLSQNVTWTILEASNTLPNRFREIPFPLQDFWEPQMNSAERITTVCPDYNARLAVGKEHTGKKLKCPKCSAIVLVQMPHIPVRNDDVEKRFPLPRQSIVPPLSQQCVSDDASKSSKHSKRRRTFGILFVLAVLAISIACGLVLHDLSRMKENDRLARKDAQDLFEQDFRKASRNRLRDANHEFVLTAIREGNLLKAERLREEMDAQEKEWKEEDFREELLEATRQP